MIDMNNLPKKGTRFNYLHRGCRIEMKIENVRIRYGNIDVALTPVSGSGELWVRYDSLLKVNQPSAVSSLSTEELMAKFNAVPA